MKTLLSLIIGLWVLLATSGCQTPYHKLSSANYLEQGAVRVAAQLYDAGELSEADWHRVVAADALFGDAWEEAVAINRDNPASQEAAQKRIEAHRQALEIADMVARWEEQ